MSPVLDITADQPPSTGRLVMQELTCTGYLDHPFTNWHFEKRWIKEKRGANVELAREALLDGGCCVGARALPNLSARFSRAKERVKKGGTEGFGLSLTKAHPLPGSTWQNASQASRTCARERKRSPRGFSPSKDHGIFNQNTKCCSFKLAIFERIS